MNEQHEPGENGSGDAVEAKDESSIVDLHPEDDGGLDLAPEAHIAESLNAALKLLRENADELEKITNPDEKVAAAERLAEQAAELEEQIGSIARKDDG